MTAATDNPFYVAIDNNEPNPFDQGTMPDDPFATKEDVRGGLFVPAPNMEALRGRLIVMVPRSFRSDAPTPQVYVDKDAKPTRDQYTVDLTVFGPEPLTYWYNKKVEGKSDPEQVETTVDSVDLPRTWTGVWIVQASLIGQLRKIDGVKFLAGRVVRGPQAPDRRKGKTIADIEAEFAKRQAAAAKGRELPTPKFSWQIDVDGLSGPDRDLCVEWWKANRESIGAIVKSTDTTGTHGTGR